MADKLAAATDVIRLAEAVGDRDMALEASSWRLFDLMELGDIQAVEAQLAAQTRQAEALRQPFYQYIEAIEELAYPSLGSRSIVR